MTDPNLPIESPNRRPQDYADMTGWGFAHKFDRNVRGHRLEDGHKKTIQAAAAIADQLRWTTSQMKPEYWPDKETLVAKQFLMSNLVQLHLKFRKACWQMPQQARDVESPVESPLPPDEKKEKKPTDKFSKDEDFRKDRQEKLMANQGAYFDYFEDDGGDEAFTWGDAIRSALRTCDAAYFEIDRHHRLLKQPEKKSGWRLDRMDVLSKRRGMPTRSNQELLIELALNHEFGGPPSPNSRTTMANWQTANDVQRALNIHLGRFMKQEPDGGAPTETRHWTTDFARKYNHPHAAEPAMFFICTHEYIRPNPAQPITKWIVGGTTPLTGGTTVWFPWADKFYKAVREQGLGSDFVAKVKAANDAQKEHEQRLLGDTTDLTKDQLFEQNLSARKVVIGQLTNDSTHQRYVARIRCQGLAINSFMQPVQCCYRCQCNYQYTVLSTHMTPSPDYEPTIDHLKKYDWGRHCPWFHQCAEALAACQCFAFDDAQNDANRPQSPRVAELKGKSLKKKKSTHLF
ncbi:uncharacterized protein J4E88_010048 [Alternaria novae-zelandiae]|uniref:uncharacterized protein n=1 Tax=Alternaria novae-zelandiae TaxID=430562 RepID=UPI0020C5834D|nr:uncharacterized protein J4E88_010048 [Alternaria novae-zelandiae]KAI4667798.1 hypothetical protein J4E88_010048 [Alternaria novae-zelandiae]